MTNEEQTIEEKPMDEPMGEEVATDALQEDEEELRFSHRRLAEAEENVLNIKAESWDLRAQIEENHFSILANYVNAFTGNRQLGINNAENIIRQRIHILQYMEDAQPALEVSEHFCESIYQEALVDFLEFRSRLNESAVEVCQLLMKSNEDIMQILRKVMDVNAEIVEFNQKNIEINEKLLENVDIAKTSSRDQNRKRITSNMQRVDALWEQQVDVSEKIESIYQLVDKQSELIEQYPTEINERKALIMKTKERLEGSSEQVFDIMYHKE